MSFIEAKKKQAAKNAVCFFFGIQFQRILLFFFLVLLLVLLIKNTILIYASGN